MRISKDGKQIWLRRPDNFHAHFRQGGLAAEMVGLFRRQGWGRVLAMPNLRPPILTHQQAVDYRTELERYRIDSSPDALQFVMTMQITEATTPAMVKEALQAGMVRAGKIYPKDMTTHSENGVSLEGYQKLDPVFEAFEEHNGIVLFHGESPDARVHGLNKEKAFLDILYRILQKFPRLKVVLEHITTAAAVEFVNYHYGYEIGEPGFRLGATITAHHLDLVLDDVIGYSAKGGYLMRPHNMCKPVAKFEEDRQALIRAILNGNPAFFYGGDDAPHKIGSKHCSDVCAGVFSTIEALPKVVQIIDERKVYSGTQSKFEALEHFFSVSGAQFYGLPLNHGEISLVKEDWVVPSSITFSQFGESDGVLIPWLAGKTLLWKLIGKVESP